MARSAFMYAASRSIASSSGVGKITSGSGSVAMSSVPCADGVDLRGKLARECRPRGPVGELDEGQTGAAGRRLARENQDRSGLAAVALPDAARPLLADRAGEDAWTATGRSDGLAAA